MSEQVIFNNSIIYILPLYEVYLNSSLDFNLVLNFKYHRQLLPPSFPMYFMVNHSNWIPQRFFHPVFLINHPHIPLIPPLTFILFPQFFS